ncbi:MAG: hypothetical protein Q9187_001584 [Circinaria calcarea]
MFARLVLASSKRPSDSILQGTQSRTIQLYLQFSIASLTLLSSATISSAYNFDQGIYARDADADAYAEHGLHERDPYLHEAIIQAREAHEVYQTLNRRLGLKDCPFIECFYSIRAKLGAPAAITASA